MCIDFCNGAEFNCRVVIHIVDTMIYFKFTVLIIIDFQIDIMCIDFVKAPSLMMTTPPLSDTRMRRGATRLGPRLPYYFGL